MIILDTNVLSELLRPEPARQVERWLAAQIAAIARTREATVATRNTSDYEGCGIELINPWTFSTRK